MDLPYQMHYHRMVTFENNQAIYLIGGTLGEKHITNQIFKLICEDSRPENCRFEEQSVKMEYGRSGHIAIPIPNSLVFDLCQIN